ncbi:MAG: TnpV protein [Oscillospiraceae bacterium]|nr:TnpV protein [Oscillospiraceae bacterium]
MNLKECQQENLLDEPVGSYGQKWIRFMEEQHPKLVREMLRKGTFEAVARSVDDYAWNYRELLDNQYMEVHPRPKTFEEIVAWEQTRAFYTDDLVMRERVLIPHRTA